MPKKSKKNRSKKQEAPSKAGEPVFNYISVCCGEKAIKEPLAHVGLELAKEAHGLGKFRCSKCGKNCKCNRSRAKQEASNG